MVSRARPTLVNLIHISLAFVKNGKNQKISAKLFGIFFLVYFKNSESVQQAVSARVLWESPSSAALDEPERKQLPRACYILSPH